MCSFSFSHNIYNLKYIDHIAIMIVSTIINSQCLTILIAIFHYGLRLVISYNIVPLLLFQKPLTHHLRALVMYVRLCEDIVNPYWDFCKCKSIHIFDITASNLDLQYSRLLTSKSCFFSHAITY